MPQFCKKIFSLVMVAFAGLWAMLLDSSAQVALTPVYAESASAAGASISGTIYDQTGTTPIIANVTISARDVLNDKLIASASVNSDGTYTLTNLDAGTYNIRALGPAYALEFYNEGGFNSISATPITVEENETITEVDFTLAPGGTISGVVYAADGVTPLNNINVAPVDIYVGACTNSDGEFTLSSLPLDTPIYIYSGSGNWCDGGGNNYEREWWPEADRSDQATAITLTSATPDATGYKFTLEQGGAIRGIVYGDDGVTPLPNINVGLEDHQIGACTNENGEYTLYGVPLDLHVAVYAGSKNWCMGGSSNYNREWWQESDKPQDVTTIAIASNNEAGLSNINFTLTFSGIVTGIVYGEDGITPLEHINVGIDGIRIGACTDSFGRYTLINLPIDEPFKIFAGGETWCDEGTDDYKKEWLDESDNADGGKTFTLTTESPTAVDQNFTLRLEKFIYLPMISRQP